jgi:hypothetical protein
MAVRVTRRDEATILNAIYQIDVSRRRQRGDHEARRWLTCHACGGRILRRHSFVFDGEQGVAFHMDCWQTAESS